MTHNPQVPPSLVPPLDGEVPDTEVRIDSPLEPTDLGGPFYWELPEEETVELLRQGRILEDEGYLAHDLNWGRRLLDLRMPYVSVPIVEADWRAPESPERFADTISAILHVAAQAGFDPEEVCVAALETRRGAEDFAVATAEYGNELRSKSRHSSACDG